jgi:hypothetical protein
MSVRKPVLAVATVAALALALALSTVHLAGAQPVTETAVFSDIPVIPNNGSVTLVGLGTNDGVLGAACTGARELGGPNIPGQVVTSLDADAIRLRVIRNNGTAISQVQVQLNCTLTFESGTAVASKLRKLAG